MFIVISYRKALQLPWELRLPQDSCLIADAAPTEPEVLFRRLAINTELPGELGSFKAREDFTGGTGAGRERL